MALKDFLRASRRYVTGHSVVKLLGEMTEPMPEDIQNCARELDKVYIPSRYPDAYDAGSPMDYYCAPGRGAGHRLRPPHFELAR